MAFERAAVAVACLTTLVSFSSDADRVASITSKYEGLGATAIHIGHLQELWDANMSAFGANLSGLTVQNGLPASGSIQHYPLGLSFAGDSKKYMVSAFVSDYSGTGSVGIAVNGTSVASRTKSGRVVAYLPTHSAGVVSVFTGTANTANFSQIEVRELEDITKARMFTGDMNGIYGPTPAFILDGVPLTAIKSTGRTHLMASHALAEPVLTRRVNFINAASEDLTTADWTKGTGVTIAGGLFAGPGGDGPAWSQRVNYDGSGAAGGMRFETGINTALEPPKLNETLKAGIFLRADTPITVSFSGNVVAGAAHDINVTTAWQWFESTGVGDGVTAGKVSISSQAGSNAAFSLYFGGADLRNESFFTAPRYQAIYSLSGYDDSPAFPLRIRFKPSGGVLQAFVTTTDFVTPSVMDFAGQEQAKVTSYQVIRPHKLTAAAMGLFIGHGGLGASSWSLEVPTVDGNEVGIRAQLVGSAVRADQSVVAKRMLLKASAQETNTILERDHSVVTDTAVDLGVGNFSDANLYIGGATGYDYHGEWYGGTIIGGILTPTELEVFTNYYQ